MMHPTMVYDARLTGNVAMPVDGRPGSERHMHAPLMAPPRVTTNAMVNQSQGQTIIQTGHTSAAVHQPTGMGGYQQHGATNGHYQPQGGLMGNAPPPPPSQQQQQPPQQVTIDGVGRQGNGFAPSYDVASVTGASTAHIGHPPQAFHHQGPHQTGGAMAMTPKGLQPPPVQASTTVDECCIATSPESAISSSSSSYHSTPPAMPVRVADGQPKQVSDESAVVTTSTASQQQAVEQADSHGQDIMVPSPQSVGREFVRQYYTLLGQAPLHLHRFYSANSTFVHGECDDCDDFGDKSVVGQHEIHRRIMELNFRQCRTKIRHIDAHLTLDSGVAIQVTGLLSNDDSPMRPFVQTFVLARQTPKKFYVHNAIFRYTDEKMPQMAGGVSPGVNCEASTSPPKSLSMSPPIDRGDMVDQASDAVAQPRLLQTAAQTIQEMAKSVPVLQQQQWTQQSVTGVEVVGPYPVASTEAQIVGVNESGVCTTHDSDVQGTVAMQMELQKVDLAENVTESSVRQSDQGVHVNENKSDVLSQQSSVAPSGSFGNIDSVATSTVEVVAATPASSTSSGTATSSTTKLVDQTVPQVTMSFASLFNMRSTSVAPAVSEPDPSIGANVCNGSSVDVANDLANGSAEAAKEVQGGNFGGPRSASRQSMGGGYGSGRPSAGPRYGLGGGVAMKTPFNGIQPGVGGNVKEVYPDSQQVFIGNLPHSCTEGELTELFKEFGKVLDIRISHKPPMGFGPGSTVNRKPNIGFVVFDSQQAVTKCLQHKSVYLKGHRINVEEKKIRQSRPPTDYSGASAGFGGGSYRSGGSVGGGGGGGYQDGYQPGGGGGLGSSESGPTMTGRGRGYRGNNSSTGNRPSYYSSGNGNANVNVGGNLAASQHR